MRSTLSLSSLLPSPHLTGSTNLYPQTQDEQNVDRKGEHKDSTTSRAEILKMESWDVDVHSLRKYEGLSVIGNVVSVEPD